MELKTKIKKSTFKLYGKGNLELARNGKKYNPDTSKIIFRTQTNIQDSVKQKLMSPKIDVYHPTYVAILTQHEKSQIGTLPVKETRFRLDKNLGVFYHLENMYNAYSDQTGDGIISNEAFIEGDNLQIMESLLEAELNRLKSIHLDKWTFCSDVNYFKQSNSETNEEETIDSIKLYLAEYTMKSSAYEMREGWVGNVRFDVNKTWMEVTKKDIEGFINDFLAIIRKAKKENLSLFLTYW